MKNRSLTRNLSSLGKCYIWAELFYFLSKRQCYILYCDSQRILMSSWLFHHIRFKNVRKPEVYVHLNLDSMTK